MATAQEEFIVNGIYNEWMKKSINLIEDSYGLTFPDSTRLKLNFFNDTNSNYAANAGYCQTGDANLEINVNMAKWLNIDENDVNGSGFDNVFAHELTHSVMQASILDFSYLPSWFKEGTAVLTVGGDERYSKIRELLKGGASRLKSNYQRVIVSTSSTSYLDTYALGYMLLRYYAKESSEYTLNTPAQVMTNLMDALKNYYGLSEAIKFASESLFTDTDNLVESFINLVDAANIKTDEDADAFIKEVAGIDYSDYGTVDNGAITGSDAGGSKSKSYEDILQETSLVEDWVFPPENQYTYDELTIIFPITTDHDDYTINYDRDTIIGGKGGNDTIENEGANVSINGGSGDDFIRNYGGGRRSTILGDYGDDYIENSCEYVTISGGEGNDTIFGGANNVTISGDKGDDFIHMPYAEGTICQFKLGDGNDTIEGFNEKHKLQLKGGQFETIRSGNDYILDSSDGSIILQDVADRNIYLQENVTQTILTVGEKNSASTVTTDTVKPVETVQPATNYVYGGSNMTIENYDANLFINLNADLTGIGLDENNFYVNSTSGTLAIKNIRDKVVSYGDANGNLIAYSYMASGGGEIDRHNFPQFEVIIGANYASNKISAGSGGSSLWGGVGGEDTLIGGAGYDEFFFTESSGYDVIQNASDNDLINLLGVTLDKITSCDVYESAVSMSLSDGSNLRVEGKSGVRYKIDNEIYTCNLSTRTWSTVN